MGRSSGGQRPKNLSLNFSTSACAQTQGCYCIESNKQITGVKNKLLVKVYDKSCKNQKAVTMLLSLLVFQCCC